MPRARAFIRLELAIGRRPLDSLQLHASPLFEFPPSIKQMNDPHHDEQAAAPPLLRPQPTLAAPADESKQPASANGDTEMSDVSHPVAAEAAAPASAPPRDRSSSRSPHRRSQSRAQPSQLPLAAALLSLSPPSKRTRSNKHHKQKSGEEKEEAPSGAMRAVDAAAADPEDSKGSDRAAAAAAASSAADSSSSSSEPVDASSSGAQLCFIAPSVAQRHTHRRSSFCVLNPLCADPLIRSSPPFSSASVHVSLCMFVAAV